MKKFMTTLLLAVGLFLSDGLAAGYKVTKVIEVGPAAWVPFTGPLRWSPDGTMLAHWANNYLKISDTLGNVRDVKAIDSGVMLRRYEWVSNDKIGVMLAKRFDLDSNFYTLMVIDINTGQDTVVEQYKVNPRKRVPDMAGDVFYEGPFLTFEGNAYYLRKTCTGRLVNIPLGRIAETIDEAKWLLPDKAPSLKENHIIRWGSDGLYLVSLDLSDSSKFAKKPNPEIPNPTAISWDRSHIINGGLIVRLADGAMVLLDTLPIQVPVEGSICGFVYVSFNPQSSEVLFQLTCDKGEMTVADRIGTFDYVTSEFTVYDPPAEAQHCVTPVYASDGRKIAFLDNDDYKAFIIFREEK
jgi:hypothetical protein